MKNYKINFMLIGILLLASCSTSKVTTESIQALNKKIESKNYTIGVQYAYPLRGKQIYLNANYELKIKNDSAFAFLPYFGVAYTAPYSSTEGGIKFSEPMMDYKAQINQKKKCWEVSFKVNTTFYNYNFDMNIFDNGKVSFTVISNQRDPISFSGEIKN